MAASKSAAADGRVDNNQNICYDVDAYRPDKKNAEYDKDFFL